MRLISFRPPIVSACVTPEPENVFHSQTCALLTIVVLIARCLYITGKGGERKEWKDKGKCFGSAFLGVNGASPNLSHDKPSTFVHFFFQREVVLWQKYTTAATLSRDWTTGIMCREVFVQLQWVISVRLRYRLLLHVLWCVAIPEFTDLISFPIWCLLSSSPCDELLIMRLWQEFPCIWPTALQTGSRRTGVLRLWSPLLLFLNSKP